MVVGVCLAAWFALLPSHGRAQTPTPTAGAFVTAVATLSLEDLAPDASLVFYGDAVRISATIDGTPVPEGASFPTGESPLDIELRYDEPLPGEIPSADLLSLHYYDGNDWAEATATHSPDDDGGTFTTAVAKTGDYAIAAPALRVIVKPTAVTLRVGETAQFTATVLDLDNQPLPDVAVDWQATSAAGTITADGLFTATGAPGTYQGAVVAGLGTFEGYADVTIQAWTTYLPISMQLWEMQVRPNDLLFPLQWNLIRIQAPQAWATTTGGTIIVAVIDSGVDMDHPDLQGNLTSGISLVSPYRYPGDCPVPSVLPEDDHGHGTHVAGIVAAVGNNTVGVSGTAWTARVMPLKVLDCHGGGSVSDAVMAIKWAVDHGARIINLSLGTPDSGALAVFEDAIDYAMSHNVLVVAASGNVDGSRIKWGSPVYPAAIPGVLGVGATTSSDAIWHLSSIGSWVDVSAPGESVLSTYRMVYATDEGYGVMTGTSMATPHVSGLAALLWAQYPQLSALQVAAIIRASADDLGPTGYDEVFGWGRINAAAAMTLARTPDVAAADSLAFKQEATVDMDEDTSLAAATDPAAYRPGRLLVRAGPDALSQVQANVLDGLTAFAAEELLPGWLLVSVPEGTEAEARAELAEQPGVQGVYFDAPIYAMD